MNRLVLCIVATLLLGLGTTVASEKPIKNSWRLAKSVGPSGVNAASDVVTLQILLNQLVDISSPDLKQRLLDPDGIWGPKTATALSDFQETLFRQDARIVESKCSESGPTISALRKAVRAVPLRSRIQLVAHGELLYWRNGKRQERDPEVSARLRQYWLSVGIDRPELDMQSTEFQSEYPWSAAFVSWVMMRAGAGENFKYAASHWRYTAAAKTNREEKLKSPFYTYRPEEKPLEPASIVVKRRSSSTATYDNVQLGHPTHGDIVVGFDGDEVLTIGGNVSNSVRITRFAIDSSKYIDTPFHFAVILVREGAQ
ncbi:MAG TPA: hypothetical protein DDW52_21270 [Planctomycetaceae bacterium]|nr:hypothetical protein [Planctomycetaceae bacterium]